MVIVVHTPSESSFERQTSWMWWYMSLISELGGRGRQWFTQQVPGLSVIPKETLSQKNKLQNNPKDRNLNVYTIKLYLWHLVLHAALVKLLGLSLGSSHFFFHLSF